MELYFRYKYSLLVSLVTHCSRSLEAMILNQGVRLKTLAINKLIRRGLVRFVQFSAEPLCPLGVALLLIKVCTADEWELEPGQHTHRDSQLHI